MEGVQVGGSPESTAACATPFQARRPISAAVKLAALPIVPLNRPGRNWAADPIPLAYRACSLAREPASQLWVTLAQPAAPKPKPTGTQGEMPAHRPPPAARVLAAAPPTLNVPIAKLQEATKLAQAFSLLFLYQVLVVLYPKAWLLDRCHCARLRSVSPKHSLLLQPSIRFEVYQRPRLSIAQQSCPRRLDHPPHVVPNPPPLLSPRVSVSVSQARLSHPCTNCRTCNRPLVTLFEPQRVQPETDATLSDRLRMTNWTAPRPTPL